MGSSKRVDAVLVGLLFLLFDFAVGGVDVVPDIVGWAMLAWGLAGVFGHGRLPVTATAALAARAGCAALAGLSLLPLLWRFTSPPAWPGETMMLLAFVVGVSEIACPTLLCVYGARAARSWASSADKLLTIGWKVGVAAAALFALTFGSLFAGSQLPAQGLVLLLTAIGAFAAGVLASIGLFRLREEGVLP